MAVNPLFSHDDLVALDVLSPREREVLGMASLGLTNQQVAMRLSVSIHAVKFHLASIYRKLSVTNRTEAAAAYIRATEAARHHNAASGSVE